MFDRFMSHALMGEAEGLAELSEQKIVVIAMLVGEPLECFEHIVLDGIDRQRARLFARRVATHAVGDNEQMAAVGALPRLRLGQARCQNSQSFGELRDQELIFVIGPNLPFVGRAEATNRQGAAVIGHDGRIEVNVRVDYLHFGMDFGVVHDFFSQTAPEVQTLRQNYFGSHCTASITT
jgi:hypothetical protein